MSERQLVREGDVKFFIEVRGSGGPQTAGLDKLVSFDGVRETIEAAPARGGLGNPDTRLGRAHS